VSLRSVLRWLFVPKRDAGIPLPDLLGKELGSPQLNAMEDAIRHQDAAVREMDPLENGLPDGT
jgi:hypothetical protein